jgi:hypothetical protein
MANEYLHQFLLNLLGEPDPIDQYEGFLIDCVGLVVVSNINVLHIEGSSQPRARRACHVTTPSAGKTK